MSCVHLFEAIPDQRFIGSMNQSVPMVARCVHCGWTPVYQTEPTPAPRAIHSPELLEASRRQFRAMFWQGFVMGGLTATFWFACFLIVKGVTS